MRSDEWQKVQELLNDVLEVEPGERRKFLDVMCGGTPDLRREVESLLACEPGAGGFLEAPALAILSDLFDGDGGADRAGQTVGHYRILREIGRGGMGAVFLAERADGDDRQKVALKVIGRGLADADLKRRFRQERQILATLDHPNIARLLDGGISKDGEPYLVMEYVEGERLDDYCDMRNLSTRVRLRLFLEVCRGISYAHQRLVVHRDIKPSNVLVTADGTPKILDFGIAKLLDPSQADGEHTRTELRAFTPEYASPEQIAGGQITTASDVYSLGVLLRDLLRWQEPARDGKRANGGWHSGTRGGETAGTDPTADVGVGGGKPRTWSLRLAGAELDNIVAMARREDPARRYISAAELAEDVQRYLDGLPVRAQKDSFTYRAGKFIRRNKLPVGAVALVALSLVVGLATALWQANVARRERDRAERRFNDVRQLSKVLLFDIAPRVERLPGSTETRQVVLAQSLKYLDSLAREAAGDLELQGELVSAYEKVGDLQGNPNNPNLIALTDALDSYEKANAMRRTLLERDPRDFGRRLLLAHNHRALGDIHWQTNELAESLRNAEAALGLYGELLAERSDSAEARRGLARTHLDIGQVHATSEKYPEAISSFRRAIALLSDAPAAERDDVEHSLLLAEGHKQLGNSLSWDGKQQEAEAEMARAVTLSESLVAAVPNDNRLRTALYQTYMMTSSVYEEADDRLSNEYAQKALTVIAGAVEKDPANVRAKQQLAKAYSRLGVTLDNTGKSDESALYLGKAVQIFRDLSEGEAKNRRLRYDLATALIRLGDAKYRQRKFDDSIRELERASEVLIELTAADARDNASLRNLANATGSMAKAYEGLAAQASGAGKHAYRRRARKSYEEAIGILRRLEANNALSKYDQKSLEKLRVILQRYEQQD